MELVHKAIDYVRNSAGIVIQPVLWNYYHLVGGPDAGWPTETEVTMSNIKRELSGEYSAKEDYRHLPLWQFTSVSDLREMGVNLSNRIPNRGENPE